MLTVLFPDKQNYAFALKDINIINKGKFEL